MSQVIGLRFTKSSSCLIIDQVGCDSSPAPPSDSHRHGADMWRVRPAEVSCAAQCRPLLDTCWHTCGRGHSWHNIPAGMRSVRVLLYGNIAALLYIRTGRALRRLPATSSVTGEDVCSPTRVFRVTLPCLMASSSRSAAQEKSLGIWGGPGR